MRYLPYARVSERGSDWHAKGIASTCVQQVAEIAAWVRAHDPQGEVLPAVTDEFASAREGSLEARPGMAGVLSSLHAGGWDVLITVDWDRVVRSVADGLELLRRLAAAGRGVVALRQQWDYSTAVGRLMLTQHIAISEYMRAAGAERTRARMIYIAAQGGWPAGRVPLGYRRRAPHDNALEIDPRAAETVRAAYRAYASGEPAASIGRRLGIPEKSLLNGILRNQIYLGRIPYAGEVHPGRHAPIISPDLWDAVQGRLPNAVTSPRPNAQKHPFVLSGLVRCACGSAMTAAGSWGKQGTQYHYYRCANPAHRPAPHVRADELETAVCTELQSLPADTAVIQDVVEELRRRSEHARRTATPELDQVRDAIRTARRDLDAIESALLQGLITPENAPHWNSRMAAIQDEMQRLDTRRTELETILSDGLGIYVTAEAMASHLARLTGDLTSCSPEERTARIRKLVTGIEMQEDGSYSVRTVFSRCSTNGAVWHPQGESVEIWLRVWLTGRSRRRGPGRRPDRRRCLPRSRTGGSTAGRSPG